jgi:hypothetical protein
MARSILIPVLLFGVGCEQPTAQPAAPPVRDEPVPKGGGEQPKPPEPVIGPEWKVAEESIALPAGLKAHAAYHFNRNALKAACLTDDGLLAVTDSGNLLRFDPKDLRLQQEIRPDAAVRSVIAAKGVGVLAADTDGRVYRVDPKTLKLTEFAKLPSVPQWMTGFRDASKQKDGVLAVAAGADEIEIHRLGFDRPSSETHKVPSLIHRGGTSVLFLDGKSRLWLGKDAGEWGGWCGFLDLGAKAGKVEALKDGHPSGVYGFVELPDGQVWAYGGTMHLGVNSGFIARVDRGKSERLALFGSLEREKADAPPKQPRYPVTHIVPDPKGDGLLVFSYRDLFRVDAKLTNWKYLGAVELRYRWGRPDAVGSYPALRTVLAVGDKSGDLICTTARDGLLRIRDGKVTQFVVPGQIGDDRIRTLLPATGATLLAGGDDGDVWRFTTGRWQATSLFPSEPPSEHTSWYEHSLMLDTDRRPVALCRSNSSPGVFALTRLKDGKLETLASGLASFNASGGFSTPDGGYWCAEREKLLRLVDGKWKQAGKAPEQFLWGLRVVGQSKPPWILHCKDSLYQLTPGKGAEDAELAPITLPAELGLVRDALALEPGQILLACTFGLRLFDEKTGKVSEPPFAPPRGSEVRALCKDGRGRTWLTGNGIWVVDAKGAVHDLGKLNRYGVVAHAIGPDAADPTGVIVALGWRGVLVVRAEDAGR